MSTSAQEIESQNGLYKLLLRYGFLILIAAFFAFFSVYTSSFLKPGNLMNIVEGSAILLILALAMTLIVTMGGIDLSVGIALDFGAAFAIVAMKDFGVAWYFAVLIALAGGAIVGLLNAFLVVKLSVSPFMATLGTFFIGSSIQRIFTNGGGPISFRRVDQSYRDLAVGDLFGIPTEVIIAAVVLLVYFVLLERSIFGKRMHAIGLQRSAAAVAGIKVRRYLFAGFVFAAAVFIGAALHPKGRPNVQGTLVGVLFLGMVANGLNLMGLNFNTKDALSGIILVCSLAIAVLLRGRS